MRRAARALVDRRTERHESRHPRDESEARLAAALERARIEGAVAFGRRWITEGDKAVLEADFAPARGTLRTLNAMSIGMAMLLAASAWAFFAEDATRVTRVLLAVVTVLAILGLPFVALGLASRRLAEEARIAKAIRVALQDEQERLPPRQRWPDEE